MQKGRKSLVADSSDLFSRHLPASESEGLNIYYKALPYLANVGDEVLGSALGARQAYLVEWAIYHLKKNISSVAISTGPVFCILLGVSSDCAQPITGQVTEVTCPVIGRAQPELIPTKRQKTDPGLSSKTERRRLLRSDVRLSLQFDHHDVINLRLHLQTLMSMRWLLRLYPWHIPMG